MRENRLSGSMSEEWKQSFTSVTAPLLDSTLNLFGIFSFHMGSPSMRVVDRIPGCSGFAVSLEGTAGSNFALVSIPTHRDSLPLETEPSIRETS
jgi:hypothetical protein